jgi:hypothetical protein
LKHGLAVFFILECSGVGVGPEFVVAVRAKQKGERLGRVRTLGNEQIKGDYHTRLRFN